MKELLRRYALGVLALGLASGYGFAAAAQEIIEEHYIAEETDPPAVVDDDGADIVIADRDGMERCAQMFRSFDPETGTYVTYAGETRPCPYLE